MRIKSLGGARFFVTFIDNSTRWCKIYILKNKNEILDCFRAYNNLVEKQTGARIKYLQSDNGRDYCITTFNQFLEAEGIQRRLSVPHTLQQNDVTEKINHTILDMARCMLLQSPDCQ
jgi:transposase InsO family protein